MSPPGTGAGCCHPEGSPVSGVLPADSPRRVKGCFAQPWGGRPTLQAQAALCDLLQAADAVTQRSESSQVSLCDCPAEGHPRTSHRSRQ